MLRTASLSLILYLLMSTAAAAQTAVPGSRLGWDQPATSLTEASTMIYEAGFDTAAPVALTGVTCAGTASPYSCAATWPQLTPTQHTVQIRAVRLEGTTRLVSPLSAVFNFAFVAVPEAPRNIRIVAPGD